MTQASLSAHANSMDRMYRYTRHVYDVTRKPYLLGRDRLLEQMTILPGDKVLEIGTGTARNLIRLAEAHPSNALYGLDASSLMLQTAQERIERSGLSGRITLRQCMAEALDYRQTFGLSTPPEVIFFSYSLSMIPTWQQALDCAITNLAPGRSIYIVDFWDQGDLPRPFAAALKSWLNRFGVVHRPELLTHMQKLHAQGRARLALASHFRRYAYIACLTPLP